MTLASSGKDEDDFCVASSPSAWAHARASRRPYSSHRPSSPSFNDSVPSTRVLLARWSNAATTPTQNKRKAKSSSEPSSEDWDLVLAPGYGRYLRSPRGERLYKVHERLPPQLDALRPGEDWVDSAKRMVKDFKEGESEALPGREGGYMRCHQS